MIVNPYKSFAGKVKGVLEKNFPSFTNRYVMPTSMAIIDKVYKKASRKRSQQYLTKKQFPLFTNIEIETINRCNGKCSFCNVNVMVDPRPFRLMEESLFSSIIEQLAFINYTGEIALYSNNEPLLDKRIFDFLELATERLPNATHYMYTNGTLLTKEKFVKLMKYLDYLIIDNYNDNLQLIKPVQDIYKLIESRKYSNRVIILLRKQNELLCNRAGSTDNREITPRKISSSCMYPFQQMVVRPDGKVSLCCNDSLGQMTLGDLTINSVTDVWNNEKFTQIRGAMAYGRNNINLCANCDTIVPDVMGSNPLPKNYIKKLLNTGNVGGKNE